VIGALNLYATRPGVFGPPGTGGRHPVADEAARDVDRAPERDKERVVWIGEGSLIG
jgi:hypothetical protein